MRIGVKDEPPENERWDVWKLFADCGAIIAPVCVLGFIIALSRLNGQRMEFETYTMPGGMLSQWYVPLALLRGRSTLYFW